MGIGRTGFRRSTWYRGARVRGLGVGLLFLGAGAIAAPAHSTAASLNRPSGLKAHHPVPVRKAVPPGPVAGSVLQSATGCQLRPPLEAEKAEQTTRAADRYFKITFTGEQDGEGSLETYTYRPAKNVAICPHGVVYKLSMLVESTVNGHRRAKSIAAPNTASKPSPSPPPGPVVNLQRKCPHICPHIWW